MEEELKHILLENFETVSGSKIKKIQISYQVFGKELGSAPVILVNHALTGNSLVSGINGWWSEIIGLEKPIDTSKYSVLCFNIPGNGFNENNFDFNLDLNLGDIALLFVKAIEQLKLAKLHAIIGGSIGGCLTWEMIALKNDLASIIIPVAADWKATDWLIANTFLQERILKNSRDPVSDARIHAMTFYRSPKSLNTRFTRTKNLDKNMYNVESWLIHHGEKLRQRFSLKSYLFMNKLLSSTDITRDGESFINKISKIKSSIHLISVDSDIFFLPNEDHETYLIAKKNNLDITNHIIKSIHGHDAFLIETKQISDIFTKIF
ncbi:alpha/beta fold hydrolase [Flavobacteriaceae bacterium]|nr:alpha/beta fold hydrolase [Flavobacteriaceae bacterium]MDA9883646.1 alpha/beta fold hydrolase [Flavobacteriaceae bacterium]MDC1009725.1 alpha/beta fold hydrolase [Flavobacteriaceae bacterium]MDC3297334.1 alpha/beta fold hydrolase [Flavobacteriaceae bacterium]